MEGIGSINEKIVFSEERAERTETERVSEQEKQEMNMPKDEYISSKKSGQKPTGLYSVEKKCGNTVIRYDDPRKAKNESETNSSIVKLKSTRDSMKIQLRKEAGNSQKAKQLQKRLKEVEKKIKELSE